MNFEKKFNELNKNGYVIIENIIKSELSLKISKRLDLIENKMTLSKNLIFEKNLKEGQVVIRDLICYDKLFLNLISKNKIINFLKKIFKDQFILDGVIASRPLGYSSKKPHIDSHISINDIKNTLDVVVMFCINDFKKNNGSTYFWKKSHLSGKICHKEKVNFKKYQKISHNIKAGSIVIFLGQTWHQLCNMQSNQLHKRWAILFHTKRWWIKPSTNYTDFFKKSYKKLTKNQKMLLGYSTIVPHPFSKIEKTKLPLSEI